MFCLTRVLSRSVDNALAPWTTAAGSMFNNRSSPLPQFLATVAAMSFRSSPSYRGGRNQWPSRGYSSRPYAPATDNVVNDNNDDNREFRPDNNPPPPRSYFRPNFNQQNQSYHPRGQPPQTYSNPYQQFAPPPLYNQNQQFRQQGPPPPQFNPNQQFRPPSFYNQGKQRPNFDQNSQFRQRQAKPVSDYRNWERSKPGPSPSCERFTILSYNILADYLAINHRSKLYFHIPRHILDWEFRKRNIMFELGLWSADILCFQEVDRFQDLEEELKNRGYIGIWKMRTGEPVDGCAIFWRSSRFKLLHEEAIEFNKFGLRDNVAQICVLESINKKVSSDSPSPACSEDCNKVVICNIHVLYNPKRGEIKLGQVRRLLDRAYATSKLWDNAPVVLCGDFNSTPKSPLYNFISEQKLNVSGLPRDRISGQYSAENRPTRPFTSTSRPQSTDNITPSSINAQSESSTDIPESTDLQLEAKEESGENDTISASPDELLEDIDNVSVGEDSTSFLSELHGPDGVDLVNGNGTSEVDDLDGSLNTNGEAFVERPVYDPSGWTPMEIEAATGSSECTTMEHKLILKSVYSEVEDYSGTRDSNGEPQVTSYHRGFQGTVDYIWRSKGLQTARVLAPIPKQAMQWTPGFPTKRWGSDHIALVAELAFSKDVNEELSQVK